jgi:spermidine synthase
LARDVLRIQDASRGEMVDIDEDIVVLETD